MVCDIELPFDHHSKMSCCQLKFLLYLLTKQDGDLKPKWWPDYIRFKQPISNLLAISKDSLINLLKHYYKFKGDSDWLRAVLYFIPSLDNLTKETDFSSIDISGKISYKGLEFDIVPSQESVSPNVKVQPVSQIVNKNKKFTIMNRSDSKLNISPALVAHLKSTELEGNKAFCKNIYKIDLMNTEKDIKLCIKESHIKRMMPTASVQLYDIVKYNTMHSKENFLLTLNLMKTDVLSKLNLLKFRKRLRNTSRDSIRSVSEFEKDLIKFRSKPNKETLKENSKHKENKKPKMKIKEKNKVESSNTTTEYMVVDDLPLSLNEIIDVDGDTDMNKENKNSSKENITTAVNSICSSVTSIPFQPNNNKIIEKTDSIIIDLTLDETTPKVPKARNLYQFFNISPSISPKSEKKMKQSPSPKNLKRLNRHSMPLMNQKDIKSYFNSIPMKLTPEFIVKKLDELKKVCKPCFVRLDLVADLKPIKSIITEDLVDEIETKITMIETLPLPIVIEEEIPVIDLTDDDVILENEHDCEGSENIKENDLKLSKVETNDKVKNKPKNDTIKKKKEIIKVKWPSKRITL